MKAALVEDTANRSTAPGDPARRRREILMFLFLAVVLWPVIAVGVVGTWGLVVWLYQAMTGAPTL